MSRIILNVIFFFIFASILMGCKSLPKPEDSSSTLLAIPIEFKRINTTRDSFRYYLLDLENSEEQIKILPKNGYKFIDYLPQGKYKIIKVHSIHKTANRPRETVVNIDFEMNSGEITVLPYLFKIWIKQEKNQKSNYYQNWSMEKLIKNEVENRMQTLFEYKNNELWIIE